MTSIFPGYLLLLFVLLSQNSLPVFLSYSKNINSHIPKDQSQSVINQLPPFVSRISTVIAGSKTITSPLTTR
jgi:hypothetical protein